MEVARSHAIMEDKRVVSDYSDISSPRKAIIAMKQSSTDLAREEGLLRPCGRVNRSHVLIVLV